MESGDSAAQGLRAIIVELYLAARERRHGIPRTLPFPARGERAPSEHEFQVIEYRFDQWASLIQLGDESPAEATRRIGPRAFDLWMQMPGDDGWLVRHCHPLWALAYRDDLNAITGKLALVTPPELNPRSEVEEADPEEIERLVALARNAVGVRRAA